MKLAELSGVSVDTIKRYEAGTAYGARLDTAYYIAGALGISLDSLLPQWPDSPSFLLQDPEVQSAVLILAERLKKIK